jgi:hypothetical protein
MLKMSTGSSLPTFARLVSTDETRRLLVLIRRAMRAPATTRADADRNPVDVVRCFGKCLDPGRLRGDAQAGVQMAGTVAEHD